MGLVGRDVEAQLIGVLLGEAQGGRGSVLVVEGAPGIGKTALVAWIQQRAASVGIGVLTARGGELERDLGFAVVRQLLEPTLRSVSPARRKAVFDGAAALANPALRPAADTDRHRRPAWCMGFSGCVRT